MPAETQRSLRCAIYTRKSTEHGLDQEFNSLDAQREACEAYIKSQASQGWKLLPQHYDDPAYSGGNLERPALKRLLREIELGRVDVVVVYKIDRLTRSLADFAKLVEAFDARSISFVAVTQQFNTTTSMGRLTLNVLLSFAQFERELASERVKDKIAASRKKGKWTGGTVPLGYDAKNKKLVINKTEAETVRTIFQLYLELKSFGRLVAELERRKIVTKRRSVKVAKFQGGIPFTYGPLAYFLKNRIYLGEIHHGGKWFKGEHPAILDRQIFDQVQQLLSENTVKRGTKFSAGGALLMGKLFDEGQPDGTELFQQEWRAVPVLCQHRLARTQSQSRFGQTDLCARGRATCRSGSSPQTQRCGEHSRRSIRSCRSRHRVVRQDPDCPQECQQQQASR
jgi:DNA invertase Pin-like site-specific DNA recombinase